MSGNAVCSLACLALRRCTSAELQPCRLCHRLTNVAKKSTLELRERISEDDYVPEFLLHARFHDSLNDPGYISKRWTMVHCLDGIPAAKVMEKLGQHIKIASDVCESAFGSVQPPGQPPATRGLSPPLVGRSRRATLPPRESDPASPEPRQSPLHEQSPQQALDHEDPNGPEQVPATRDSETRSPLVSGRDTLLPRESDPASPPASPEPRQSTLHPQSPQQPTHDEGQKVPEQRAPEIMSPQGRINLWDVPYDQTWQPNVCETGSSEF